MLLRRAGLTASAGLSCYFQGAALYGHFAIALLRSPVPMYIITFSPPRLRLSMKVILCVAYCTKTVF